MGNERFLVSVFFLGAMCMVLAFSQRTYADTLLVIFLAVSAIIPMLIPKRKKVYQSIQGTVKGKEKTSSSYNRAFVSLERYFPLLRILRTRSENTLTKNIPSTGVTHDPEDLATKYTRISFVAFCVSLPIALLLYQQWGPLGLLALIAMPLAYMAPLLQMKLQIVERREKIEEEIAFFLCYVNVMQAVSVGLYKCFRQIRGQEIFTAIERDAREIVKKVEMLGIPQHDALGTYASTHPSQKFREFIDGYLAKITSVGDVPTYTEAKADYFFKEYMYAWDRYEKSAQEIFGSILMIGIILPMMVAFNALLGSSGGSGLMILMGLAIPPILAMVVILVLNSKQPSSGVRTTSSAAALFSGVMVGIMVGLAGVGLPTAVGVACFVGGFANFLMTKKSSAEQDAMDSMMPEFMRDVTELSKTGMNINRVIQRQAGRKSYRKQFNDMLNEVALKIHTGMSFDVAILQTKTHSTLVRFIMFILAKAYVNGADSAAVFNSVTNFITDIEQKKRAIRKGLSFLMMIVFVSPFLTLGIAHILMSVFTGTDSDGMTGDFDVTLPSINEDIIQSIELITISSSIPMGVVAAKMATFSVKNTFAVATTALCAVLAIHTVPVLIGMVGMG